MFFPLHPQTKSGRTTTKAEESERDEDEPLASENSSSRERKVSGWKISSCGIRPARRRSNNNISCAITTKTQSHSDFLASEKKEEEQKNSSILRTGVDAPPAS